MTRKTCRPFTLADGMILIAACAVGMAGYVATRDLLRNHTSGPPADLLRASTPLLAMTLGCLAVRFRVPRPDRRRLMRQPGFVACTAAVLGISAWWSTAAAFALWEYLRGRPVYRHILQGGILIHVLAAGCSTFISWAMLAIAGRWRCERGWIDSLGIAIGVCWLLLAQILVCIVL